MEHQRKWENRKFNNRFFAISSKMADDYDDLKIEYALNAPTFLIRLVRLTENRLKKDTKVKTA